MDVDECQLHEEGAEQPEEDEFGLVESALGSQLRPVVRRCDVVLPELDSSVRVSGITSEQRRALGRMEGEADLRTDIVQDPVKLEVEEHELSDADAETDWTPRVTAARSTATPSVGDYGRPYKTTSVDRRSRAASPGGRAVRGSVGGRPRGLLRVRGRGAPMVRVLARGRGTPRARRAGGRSRFTAARSGGARAPAAPVVRVIDLADCYVELVRDKLTIRRKQEKSGQPPLTQADLSFMDLVRVKEAVVKMADKANASGPDTLVTRLRMARRQSFAWVEARLKQDAQSTTGDTSPHGKLGRSKYNMTETPAPTRFTADVPRPGGVVVTPARPTGAGAPLHARSVASARHVTVGGLSSPATRLHSDDGDMDSAGAGPDRRKIVPKPTFVAQKTPLHIRSAQKIVQPEPVAARLMQARVKNPKTSRDIVILQAKLRDLQNVGSELRRAVDYFNMEAQKDRQKVTRLKAEHGALQTKLAQMETSLVHQANPMLVGLLDKERRKQLPPQDAAVLECGELLAEVGRDNYQFVLDQGMPLLSARELDDKTHGIEMNWSLDPVELALAAAPQPPDPGKTPRGRGRGSRGARGARGGAGRGRAKKPAADAGAAVDAAVEAVVAASGSGGGAAGSGSPTKRRPAAETEAGEHISLPQEVLEQVMNGKGYLVDENGERLEIRMVGDSPVIAGGE